MRSCSFVSGYVFMRHRVCILCVYVCVACSVGCPAGSYESSPCSNFADRVCTGRSRITLLNVCLHTPIYQHVQAYKVKTVPYSIEAYGSEPDSGPNGYATEAINSAVGCCTFRQASGVLFQPLSITALWPVPNYTAW